MHDPIQQRVGTGMRRFVASLLVVSALTSISCAPAHAEGDIFRDKFISLGTSSRSGIYHVVGSNLCETVNQERRTSLMRCVTYNTVGSEYNAEAVAYGELIMGITLPDIAYAQFHAKKTSDTRGADLRSVMSLHSKPIVMIVRRGANITDVSKLAGHSINIGNRGSGQRFVVDIILKALGLKTSDFSEASELHTTKMGEAFCAGKIDIMVESLGNTSPFYKKMIDTCDGVILTFPAEFIDKMLAENPLMNRLTIPGGLYPGYAEPIQTSGYRAVLVTSVKVSDEAVFRFVSSVMNGVADLKKSDPALEELDAEKMLSEGLAIPLHPGVIKYLNNRKAAANNVKPTSR